jgi:hypothetical protein
MNLLGSTGRASFSRDVVMGLLHAVGRCPGLLCRVKAPDDRSSDTKSRSRRCHNVWHVPRSNRMRRESTGTHLTLKLANSGRTSVGRARFKSPLAHLSEIQRRT